MIGCIECKRFGAFNTLVIFNDTSAFDLEKEAAEYSNYYTDCVNFDEMPAVDKSRFMFVQTPHFEDSLLCAAPVKISEMKFKFVDENALKAKLPRIFAAFTGGDMPPVRN